MKKVTHVPIYTTIVLEDELVLLLDRPLAEDHNTAVDADSHCTTCARPRHSSSGPFADSRGLVRI